MDYMFETAHLKARKFTIADAHRLYENHSEEEVKKWIPNESYADLEEAQDAIHFYIETRFVKGSFCEKTEYINQT